MASKYFDTCPARWAHPAEVAEEPENAPRPETQLAGEIAARFVEWADVESRARASQWITTCAALQEASPLALWLYLGYQSGDSSVIAKSFQEIADETASRKQNAHALQVRALDAMATVLPELAAKMRAAFTQYHTNSGDGNGKRVAMHAREDEATE